MTSKEAQARREQAVQALIRMAEAEQAARDLPPVRYVPPLFVPSTTIMIRTVVGSQGLPHDARVVRRYIEAVALCLGGRRRAQEIPKAWEPLVRKLHAACSRGLPWRSALTEIGLEAPNDLTPHIAACQQDLHALWDKLPGIVGRALERTNDIGREKLKDHLRRLLG